MIIFPYLSFTYSELSFQCIGDKPNKRTKKKTTNISSVNFDLPTKIIILSILIALTVWFIPLVKPRRYQLN